MKKTIAWAFAVTAFSAVPLLAQGPFGALTSSAPDPATIVQHRVARLTALLTLTTEQANQATTIFTNAQNSLAPFETSLSQARQALPPAVKSNATGTIDQLATQIGSATTQITAIQNKADAAFYAILTADQQTKLSQNPGRGRGGFGSHGMGARRP